MQKVRNRQKGMIAVSKSVRSKSYLVTSLLAPIATVYAAETEKGIF